MATITKIPLSGSSHGKGIKVAATSIGSGDTIHTADPATVDGEGDDIRIYAFNSTTVSVELTLGWGGTSDPDDLIKKTIPPGEMMLIVPGFFLRNTLVVKAAAGTTNVITLHGYVIRST